ncbi:MAG: DUF885 family protein [Anaerolineae bacterium]|nr:DUF885 family protein [Anaerolineae bacterium]
MKSNLFELVAKIITLITMVAAACTPQPAATPPPSQPENAVTESPSGSGGATGLEGLDFDAFLEESYKQLLIRDPEVITQLGLAEFYNTGKDHLTDISAAYIAETQQLQIATLEQLRAYDRATLTPEQQLSYDIYEWNLDDLVRGHPYAYHSFPVSFLITTSVPKQTLQFLVDLFPIASRQDARDYVACLSQVDDKYSQLIDGLKQREQAGVIPPAFLIPWYLGDLQEIARSSARSTPYYTVFAEKVKALGLDAQDEQALLDAAEKEITNSVLPAYESLVAYMKHLQTVATDGIGAWRLPDGDAYYAYMVRHFTTTDMTPEQIHELGLHELERIHAEMRAAFDELGYPQDESLPDLYERVARDDGFVSGGEAPALFESIIKDAQERTSAMFDLRPQAEVIVIGGEEGNYYNPPAVDGSRPGMFYAVVSGSQPRYNLASLAYHETVPGHHHQIALSQELPLPTFRKGNDFLAYVEGWALYAERLAYELGFYEDDPYGNLGRLQYEAFRAARLVVDTGIHAQKWDFDRAVDFMVENTGMPQDQVQGEIARYVMWPGQALAYSVGMLKLLEVRQRAKDEFGDQFDFKEFHNVVLKNGAVPLSILEKIIDDYIASNAPASTAAPATSSSAYLGQVPPELTPQVFAPGIVSIPETSDYAGSFSPDGTEFYFTRGTETGQNLYETHSSDGVWSEPAPAAFSAGYDAHEPHVAFDNHTLYFGWFRPSPPEEKSPQDYGIWATERTAGGWAEPRYVGLWMFVSSDQSEQFYVTDFATRSVGQVTLTGGRFTDWQSITKGAHPCIAPDGSYLIYDLSGEHMFVKFRSADGKWGATTNLVQYGLPLEAGIASISPDGKYLFYGYQGDLYWVSTELITNLENK